MKNVRIVEVGLRDGLQSETSLISIQKRVELLKRLVDAGEKYIEIGAFVSAKWIPQMAETKEMTEITLKELNQSKAGRLVVPSALVPNERGMQDAVASGIKEVAIFTACTETFAKKNINCTIDESFGRFEPVMKLAKKHKIKVRGYLSTCFVCPYEGAVDPKKVVAIAKRMYGIGAYEISVGDTIGAANIRQVRTLFNLLKKVIPVKNLAGHFHDTRGQALANILAAYELGVKTFDSSIGGLGGCPYAPGAAGNVATEDVVFMFEGMKVNTGINLQKLIDAHRWLQPMMNHDLSSKVGRVGLAQRP